MKTHFKRHPSLLIAYRYFADKRKRNRGDSRLGNLFIGQNFIKTLSSISKVGVGVGAAALVIILSVFNGLEELTKGLYNTYNPELKVLPLQGKSFVVSAETLQQLEGLPEITAVTEVIEDDAYLSYSTYNTMVRLKGVSNNFLQQYPLQDLVVSGRADLSVDGVMRAIVGAGVVNQLVVELNDARKALLFYYPRREGRVVMNPERALVRKGIRPGGVVAIEQKFDDQYVIVPLQFTRELMGYPEELTSIELKVAEGVRINRARSAAMQILGPDFEVLTSEEQQADVLRAVQIERLFVFFTFVVILAIASLNVFFSLAMLAIEKRKDMAMLISMGATTQMIKRIFIWEGILVAFTGAFVGLLAGFGIVFLQQQFGFVPLAVHSSVIDAYPVGLKLSDFLYTGLVVILVTIAASYIPARNAARIKINELL